MPQPLAFYRRLPVLPDFAGIADSASYSPAPRGWSVIIADIEDSTDAIREGRYKEVNLLGASVLAGVFNALGDVDLPFVFGGDGATVVVPDALVSLVLPSFVSARRAGRELFNLRMRIGVVPLDELIDAGHSLGIAKVALGDSLALAAFCGDGLIEAERRVKEEPGRYAVNETDGDADLDGLECRWNGIPSPGGVMLSVLVRPAPGQDALAVLRNTLADIRTLHPEAGPIAADRMSISVEPGVLAAEHRIRNGRAPKPVQSARLAWLRIHTRVGRFLIERRMRIPGILDLSGYKEAVVNNSDHRKFDGTLRLVLATDPARSAALESRLEERHRAGELAYGTHADREALMTCVIFNRQDRHLHFIDGNNGGYAMAAAALKRRPAAL